MKKTFQVIFILLMTTMIPVFVATAKSMVWPLMTWLSVLIGLTTAYVIWEMGRETKEKGITNGKS